MSSRTCFSRPRRAGRTLRRSALVLGLALAALPVSLLPTANGLQVMAQGLFSPAISVDDDVITRYELEQRARFLEVTGSSSDPLNEAREELILDALRRKALRDVGLVANEEDVTQGMRDLAQRANLSLEQFVAGLKQSGVDVQTLRDYTATSLAWRDYVAGRFLGQARPTEDEIDRAMGQSQVGSVQVLLAEVILPITPETALETEDLALQIAEIRSPATFAATAGQFSAADSRTNGGRLPWMPISRLPRPLQSLVLEMKVNEVTDPVPLQGALALFQFHGLREVAGREPNYAAIEYMRYLIPGGRSPEALAEAQSVLARVDTCDDFYGIAKDQDPARLERITLPPSELPRDVALELAKLDSNETSTALTRDGGQNLMVLMLCGRTAELASDEDDIRTTVANALTQKRLSELADSFLEQQKANARIDFK
ncbi:peptidylprolyl isomerase [Tritonibacter multivorans]|uniref:peptidylprolyl isomerase n=1 Tax=Tritonibacter multivorans TaxID=928856 RepID=UPI00071CD497|nr:peptidylprolyl isomerase [Tritonibacter multivorans]MDA7420785.1 peptidylprolyl isomerase [Tritonibacter multivorans]